MSRHLVIGATGLVGRHLWSTLSESGQALGTFYNHPENGFVHLQIEHPEKVETLFHEYRPEWVYLTAALSNVDYCQGHPEESRLINCIGTLNVVRSAKKIGAKVVFISSDYIFDGQAGPYHEEDIPNPINIYGLHKLIAELIISQLTSNYLIIRTTQVFGKEPQEKNFVLSLLSRLEKNIPVPVAVDQVGNPTYAQELAQAIFRLVSINETGVYHAVGAERISRYQFALEISKTFGESADLIQPTETRNMNLTAHRPLQAGLITEKVEEKLGYALLGFQYGLNEMANAGGK